MAAAPPVDIYIHPKFLPLINEPHTIADIHGGRYGMKCLAKGTPVLMADGTIRAVEEIGEGELVMGPDSAPRRVTGTVSGVGPLYRIYQRNGMTYTATGNHVLSLRKSASAKRDLRMMHTGNPRSPHGRYANDPDVVNIPVEEYLQKTERWRTHFRGYRAGLIRYDAQDVTIPAYFLGLWLGDGHSYSLRIYNEDPEIITFCEQFAQFYGLRFRNNKSTGCRELAFLKGDGEVINQAWKPFRDYDLLGNKHIPHAYKANSEAVRLDLLAGLLDTDGHYRESSRFFVIALANERLARDVYHLACGMGFRCTITERATICGNNGVRGKAWSVSIGGDVWRIPCLIKRKQPKKADFNPKETLLSTLKVERVPDGEWFGFSLDGDHLFCLADGTVTHNTETVWRLALMRAMNEPLRVLGARETLASIKDSSHKTISDIIYGAELAVSQGGPFEIQSDRIIRRDPEDPQRIISEFFYAGVRESIRDKKSLAGIDLVVFDEAGKVSQDTLDVFLPTIIRKPNCKAWFIWNPESTADPIWKWFNVGQPSNCLTVETSYLDNPWLSAEALRLVEDCEKYDPEKYEHLYLGKPQSAVAGAIFGAEYKTAFTEGRIGVIPYNRTKPVHTAWDLGMDRTVIWFVQAYDGHLWFIDYYANENQEISHYLIELQRRPYVYGSMHLPHDSVNTVIHRRGIMGRNPNLEESPQSMMREAGFSVVVGPTNMKRERIDASRRKWPVCKFDHVKCSEGLEGLKSYQWDRDLQDNGERKPLHNWASHPADAFMEACINVKERSKKILPVAHSGAALAEI